MSPYLLVHLILCVSAAHTSNSSKNLVKPLEEKSSILIVPAIWLTLFAISAVVLITSLILWIILCRKQKESQSRPVEFYRIQFVPVGDGNNRLLDCSFQILNSAESSC